MKPPATAGDWVLRRPGWLDLNKPVETACSRTKPWCDSWYGFCVWRQQVHRERNEPVAAMIWWSLRMIDQHPICHRLNPIKSSGAKKLRQYWEFKLPITMREQDELCH